MECWGSEMFRKWDVKDVGCWRCGILGMWDVGDVGCSRCGMFGMWDVRDVRCLPVCGMLIYQMPFFYTTIFFFFVFFFLNNNRCKVSLNTCKQCITLRLSLSLTRRSLPLFWWIPSFWFTPTGSLECACKEVFEHSG